MTPRGDYDNREAREGGREALERGPRGANARDESRRGARAPEKKINWMVVLLASALPLGTVIWIATMSSEKRQKLYDSIPSGVATRAAFAVGTLVAMAVLIWAVLPAAKAAIAVLRRGLAWCRAKQGAARIAAYPVEFVTYLGWLFAQMLFAVDFILILACGGGFLLYVVKIVKPEMFTFLPG